MHRYTKTAVREFTAFLEEHGGELDIEYDEYSDVDVFTVGKCLFRMSCSQQGKHQIYMKNSDGVVFNFIMNKKFSVDSQHFMAFERSIIQGEDDHNFEADGYWISVFINHFRKERVFIRSPDGFVYDFILKDVIDEHSGFAPQEVLDDLEC